MLQHLQILIRDATVYPFSFYNATNKIMSKKYKGLSKEVGGSYLERDQTILQKILSLLIYKIKNRMSVK